MAYSKQTWIDDDESSPISAQRLQHIEDGVEAAHNIATNVTRTSLGVNNVDNTSDASKPVSTQQQTAIDGKATKLAVATVVTANGAAAVNSHNPVDATSGNLTITLPTGQSAGTVIVIEKSDSSTNTVICSGNIRGVSSSTLTLALAKESIEFLADSAGSWWPIAGHKTLSSIDGRISAATAKIFTPEQYGAVGNGIVDDTTAVNAAIAAANAARGGTVYFAGSYKVTSSILCTSVSDVALVGTTRARTSGSGIIWAGPNSGSTIKADNATGLVVSGLSFAASSSTFAGIHIDFRNLSVYPQAFHVLIEWCFFTGGGASLHTDIHTGGGHNYSIIRNNFYKSNIAIMGSDTTLTPTQVTASVLIERNWFEAYRGTTHIANPGSGWKITCNAAEPLLSGLAGFVKLIGGAKLINVTIEDNWCGDVGTGTSTQIEVAGGPFRITNNVLGLFNGSAITAVGVIDSGCTISNNRVAGQNTTALIDWGSFTHAPTAGSPGEGGYHVTGNNAYGTGVVLSRGTAPKLLVSDAAGYLSFTHPPMPTIASSSVSGTVALDGAIHRSGVRIYLDANVTTMTIANPLVAGQLLTIMLQQDGVGASTFVWPSTFTFSGSNPTCTGAFAVTVVTMQYNSGTARWYEASRSIASPVGAFVGTTDTQTLTNKTLTSPVIGTIVNTGTLTLPTSTDTLVGRATTDTLTNKTLVTPALGAATATSVNKVAITAPATSATITIANSKTLTVNNTLTFAGTDSTTINLPASGNVVGTTDTQTLTNKTLTAPLGIVKNDIGGTRRTISANTSLVITDWVVFVNGTSITATLPTASTAVNEIRIANIHATASVSVASAGGTINGATTFNLPPNSSAIFETTGTNWVVF